MQKTAYITHPSYLNHRIAADHPESPKRLEAIEQVLQASALLDELMIVRDPPKVSHEALLRAHCADHIAHIHAQAPETGTIYLDQDTAMNPHTLLAAQHAAGAAVLATDKVMQQQVQNAFCALRPPGHHAESDRSMGFCLFNNVAIAALHAQAHYGCTRIAIVDFDVHHGNGTEEIMQENPAILFCSSFQFPHYPGGFMENLPGRRLNMPLREDARTGAAFRATMQAQCLPALHAFKPEIIFISAGFDAHRDDPLAQLLWDEQDYSWITQQLLDIAQLYAQGRIVSVLEGGYALPALAQSVYAHLKVLAQ